MGRSIRVGALAAAALALAADAGAERLRFSVDPARSTLRIAAGTDLIFAAGGGLFGIGSRTLPVQAPASGAGAVLPNGSTSDGLTTSIAGFFIAELDAVPSAIRLVPGASRLDLGTSGSWLPGPPLAPTTPTSGDLAAEFDDATFAWGTSLVLRDAIGSVESSAAVPLAAAGTGEWTFAAGCGTCPSFRLSQALLDVAADRLGTARTSMRRVETEASTAGTQGELRTLGDGRYELTLPVSVTLSLGAAELRNPLTQSVNLVLAGEIVAVPEPGATLQMVVVLAGLGVLAARGIRRGGSARRRRRSIVFALAAASTLEVGGCPPSPTPSVDAPDPAQVQESCDSQDLNVTKNGGSPVSNPAPSPDCNPDNFQGFIGEGGEQENFNLSTDAFLFGSGLAGNGRCGFSVTLTGPTAPNTMELDQRCFQRIIVPAVAGGASLVFRALRLGLGSAANEATPAGSVTVTPPGGSAVVVPLSGLDTQVPISAAGGTIDIQIVVNGTRTLGGQGYQGIFTQYAFQLGQCLDSPQCLAISTATPFCGAGVCHDGRQGRACDDASSCDYAGAGQLCDDASGTCQPEAALLAQ